MSAQAHAAENHGHHILPLKTYFGVATALLVFTVITVYVAQHDFGSMNMAVALLVAAVKASLVCLYFMHLLYDNKLYAVVLVSSLLFLAIFITFVMYDVVRRDGVYVEKQNPIVEEAVIYQSEIFINSSDTTEHSSDSEKTSETTDGETPSDPIEPANE